MRLNLIQQGFSLTELAVVLLIFSLLLGGLLVPVAAQRDTQRLRQAETGLHTLREALLGYAAVHGQLPCPDTDTNPTASGYGVAETDCSSTASLNQEGFLPFKSLGLPETDPWEQRWRYRVDSQFASNSAPITLNTGFGSDSLQIQNLDGVTLTTTLERPVAIFYSVGPNSLADRENSSYEASSGRYQSSSPGANFDDQLQWLGRPLLISRLIAAGRPL